MDEQMVFASVTYGEVCQGCGADLECHGVQLLVDGRLRWDVESMCSACGSALFACGGDVPGERRDQMLSEHGPATLHVISPSARNVAVMRVLRAELDIDLVDAEAVLRRVRSGDCSGTLPERELLSRKLRAAGLAAVATRS
ncbi:hypothetical protein [Streptomyces sp. NPDC020362]|uniref:hypothetical protein n=1 Tax=unclassified Streptomyces TaxID=2593676 RepID=UPI0033DC8AD3